jgi:hypothetical protein
VPDGSKLSDAWVMSFHTVRSLTSAASAAAAGD